MLSFHVSLEAYFLPKPILQVVFRGSSLGMQPEALGRQRRTNLLRAPSLNLKYSFPLTTVFMTPGGTCFWKAPSFRIHLGVCVFVCVCVYTYYRSVLHQCRKQLQYCVQKRAISHQFLGFSARNVLKAILNLRIVERTINVSTS